MINLCARRIERKKDREKENQKRVSDIYGSL